MEPWVDFKDLRPGQRFREELEIALDAAQWLVILVGPDSRPTPWQEEEWSAALAHTWADSGKKLLPVIFGENDPPPFLRSWVSLRIDPEAETSAWTRRVLDTLGNSQDPPSSGMGPRSRELRRNWLEEVQRAAEQLWERQPAEPPPVF